MLAASIIPIKLKKGTMYLTNIPPKTICVVRKKIGTSNILEIACEHFQKNSQNMRSLRYMRRVEKSWAWVFFLATGYNGSFQVSLENKKVSKNTSAFAFEAMILSSSENDFSEIATPTQNWVFFCTEVGFAKVEGHRDRENRCHLHWSLFE